MPAGARFREAGAGVDEGGKMAPSGEGGSVLSYASGSMYVPGVTFGAKITLRRDGDAIPYFPGLMCVRPNGGVIYKFVLLTRQIMAREYIPLASEDRRRRETRAAGIAIVQKEDLVY